MSGYRAFSREVAISLPIVATGFDVETEMTIQLLYRHCIIQEVPVPYKERPKGSCSKLRTFRDGIRVLLKISGIFKAYKPLTFFGGFGLLALLACTIPHYHIALGLFNGFQHTSILDAVASAASILCCLTLFVAGAIVHALNFRILEMTSVLTFTSITSLGFTLAGGSWLTPKYCHSPRLECRNATANSSCLPDT